MGGPHHGQRRPVEPDAEGKWPGVVDGNYLFWRFEGGGKQWPAYYATGAGQAELEDAVKIAGWPRWPDPQVRIAG